jgi:cell division protein FtsL
MAADNSAYDYFLQNNPHKPENNKSNTAEKRIPADEPEVKRAPKITMKVTPPKRGSASKVFFAALSALLVFFCVIYGRVETNRMYRQIADQNQKLESAQSENVRLKSELESKMTLKNVEDYAVNVLGLQKLDNSQIKYVQTQTDDIVEIPEENKNIFVKAKEKFDGFMEYIFG